MQIMGVLGQDNFKQARIAKDVNERTLPHFFRNDDTPEARGYIQNSYLDGLSPHEFFFHHMTGREGLIDTAIRTAETGYISRKLMKGLEDIGLKYDLTVRTSNNIILQYIYGDFNLNQIMQKVTKLNTLVLGDKELKKNFSLNEKEIKQIAANTGEKVSQITKDNEIYVKTL